MPSRGMGWRHAVPLAAVLFGSPLALAQSSRPVAPEGTAAAQPVERARVRYRLGVEAFEAGRFRAAVDYFLEADDLSPSAALSFNIARAYAGLGESAATLRWLRDYLRRAPAAADRAEVEAEVRKYEGELAATGVQQISLFTAPPGATVVVDGKKLGVTPWTGELPVGTHGLSLELAGHDTLTRDLVVSGDRAEDIVFELRQAAAPEKAAAPRVDSPGERATSPRDAAPAHAPAATWMTPVGWASVGTGGALLGAALVFEVLRRGAESDAQEEKTQIGYRDQLERMEGRQTAARILGVAGVVVGVAGGVLVWLGGRESSETTVGAACLPGRGCEAAVRGAF